jgi:hypothetical protein
MKKDQSIYREKNRFKTRNINTYFKLVVKQTKRRVSSPRPTPSPPLTMSNKRYSPTKVSRVSNSIFQSKPRRGAKEYVTVSNYTMLARQSIEARNCRLKAVQTMKDAKVRFGGNGEVSAFHEDLLLMANNLDPEKHQSDRQVAEFFAALKFSKTEPSRKVIDATLMSQAMYNFLELQEILGTKPRRYSKVLLSIMGTNAINNYILELDLLKRKFISWAEMLDFVLKQLHSCNACKCHMYTKASPNSPLCTCNHGFEFHSKDKARHHDDDKHGILNQGVEMYKLKSTMRSFDKSASKINHWFDKNRYSMKHRKGELGLFHDDDNLSTASRLLPEDTKLKRLLQPRLGSLKGQKRACPVCSNAYGDLPGVASKLHIKAVKESFQNVNEGRTKKTKKKKDQKRKKAKRYGKYLDRSNLAVPPPKLPLHGPWQKWMVRENVCVFCSQFFENEEYDIHSKSSSTSSSLGPKPASWLKLAGMRGKGQPSKHSPFNTNRLSKRQWRKPYTPTTFVGEDSGDGASSEEEAPYVFSDGEYSDLEEDVEGGALTLDEKLADAKKEQRFLELEIERVKGLKQDLLEKRNAKAKLKEREDVEFQTFLQRQRTFWEGPPPEKIRKEKERLARAGETFEHKPIF